MVGLMVGPRIAGARGHLIDPVSTFREVRVVLAIALRKHYRLWPHSRLWIVFGKAKTDAKRDFGFSRKFRQSCYDSVA